MTPDVESAAVTELLLRVMTRGVIDRATARAWSGGLDIDDRAISMLVAEGVLAEDDEFLYVTEAGDQRLTRGLCAQVPPGDSDALAAFADEFTALDTTVKVALTAWQLAQRENDPQGQLAAVEQWLDADRRLQEAADRSGVATRLFGRYLDRLEDARQAVLAGQTEQLSGAGENSYHSTWFLLHEILLRSLGRERRE